MRNLLIIAAALLTPSLAPAAASAQSATGQPNLTNAPKLTVGMTVTGSDGIPVGTIEAIGGRTVRVKLAWGKTIEPSPSSFREGQNGVAMELTAQQIREMTGGSKLH